MSDALKDRIDQLETLVAFQEQSIEELNVALAQQFKDIEALKHELKMLGAALRDMETHPALAAGREPPPPHY
jgi:SlyX protein